MRGGDERRALSIFSFPFLFFFSFFFYGGRIPQQSQRRHRYIHETRTDIPYFQRHFSVFVNPPAQLSPGGVDGYTKPPGPGPGYDDALKGSGLGLGLGLGLVLVLSSVGGGVGRTYTVQ
ncbi:hypothetical protein F4778DRAFT_759226 [Xylariomycetidae sp. FL2044]|nr:hypothetical protein F4778DRAFT_759226 [Xylariomycetidae sp. FL2044]